MAAEYVDKTAIVSWQELQIAQKKAMEELLILQDKQNDEFVAKHGLPAHPKAQIDNVCDRYGTKAVRKHLDDRFLKLCMEVQTTSDPVYPLLVEQIPMVAFPEIKAKAEARLAEVVRLSEDIKEVNNSVSDILDEPIAVKKFGNAKAR